MTVTSLVLQALNCTILRAGAGLPPVASTPHARHTRRPCCLTARSLLQQVWIIQIIPWLLRVRNSTILHRLQRPHQHQRRPHSHAYTNTDSHSYGDVHADAHTNGDSHGHGDSDSYADSNTNTYA